MTTSGSNLDYSYPTTSSTTTEEPYQPAQVLSPEKQAQLRDDALAKILMKSNRAGYAELRLGGEVLARDSKKTGYFPARLVCKDDSDKPIPPDHIRIHYDGRPEGEFRDIPKAFIYPLPDQDHFCHLNILLSPWVLLDDLLNFENTPLLAYAKVFDQTDFRKIRVLFDGNFELVDRKGRIAKVKAEWVHQHSTVHPDAIKEAVEEARNHEQFLDLIYGASQKAALKLGPNHQTQSTKGPMIPYGNEVGESNWLPAAFASAIHIYAENKGIAKLKDCTERIYQQGKGLPVNSKLRANFLNLVNHITEPLGYRMEPLKLFHLKDNDNADESKQTPVVAFINMGNGFGRCLSVTGQWVLDPCQEYAFTRTTEELCKVYGKEFDSKAVWSYGLLPVRGNELKASGLLVAKKKNRRKRPRGRNQDPNPWVDIPDKHSRKY